MMLVLTGDLIYGGLFCGFTYYFRSLLYLPYFLCFIVYKSAVIVNSSSIKSVQSVPLSNLNIKNQ